MIGFIGAMDEEVAELVNLMDEHVKKMISGIEFYEGIIDKQHCVVLKSGIGKINAAMATAILFENYKISGIVNIGTAGGLKENEQVLDVIISDRVANYDLEVPGWDKGFHSDKTAYKADDRYIEIMKEIISANDRVYIGDIASGDAFISNDRQIQKILKDYPEALCAEMEAAGIAQVCKHYRIPFIVIRSLSDIAVTEGNELDFDTYIKSASKRSALWCKEFITKLKEA